MQPAPSRRLGSSPGTNSPQGLFVSGLGPGEASQRRVGPFWGPTRRAGVPKGAARRCNACAGGQPALRDYFIAQAASGALVWIYRRRLPVGPGEPGWFLQGLFA